MSRFSLRLMNPISFSSNPFTVSIRCFRDLPARSNFQTTIESPFRAYSKACFNPGLSSFAPETLSVKIFSHPELLRASICKSKFCSLVETGVSPHAHQAKDII